jgi:hypothetical protein
LRITAPSALFKESKEGVVNRKPWTGLRKPCFLCLPFKEGESKPQTANQQADGANQQPHRFAVYGLRRLLCFL